MRQSVVALATIVIVTGFDLISVHVRLSRHHHDSHGRPHVMGGRPDGSVGMGVGVGVGGFLRIA